MRPLRYPLWKRHITAIWLLRSWVVHARGRELRGFEVSFRTSRDCFGPADPSNPWHLGNRVGNHSMWQAVNLVETEGPAGNSVAVSATKAHSEEVQYSPEKRISHLFSIDLFRQGLSAFIDSQGHPWATMEQLPNRCPQLNSEIQNTPYGIANQKCQATAGKDFPAVRRARAIAICLFQLSGTPALRKTASELSRPAFAAASGVMSFVRPKTSTLSASW